MEHRIADDDLDSKADIDVNDPDVKEFKFTTARLGRLRPRLARYEKKDSALPGLVLRVSPSGVKSFSVFRWVRATRRPERITLGKWTGEPGGLGIDAARRQALDVLKTINDNKSPAVERNRYHDSDTFETVFKKWMENHVLVHLAKKSAIDFQGVFDHHIVPSRLHLKKITDITHADVEALHAQVGKSKCMPRTANKMAGVIRAVYRHAAKHVNVPLAIPTMGLRKFDTPARTRFLQPNEMPRFLAALAETPQPYRDLFRLLMLTGVRLGNMMAARFDQFDLTHGLWTIDGAEHKNKQPHTMPLDDEALAIVKRRAAAVPKGIPWLWPSEGKRPSKSGHVVHVSEPWADLLARADITGLVRHDIRRTLGSWMAMGGAGLPIIGKQLGHVSQASTQVYARLATGASRDALQSTLARMNAAGAPVAKPRTRKG